jgi:hypothetical protein
VDIEAAATLLREELRLPEWAASVSPAEVDGREAIVVCVEPQQARHVHGVSFPRFFEGYPVIVEIRPKAVPD